MGRLLGTMPHTPRLHSEFYTGWGEKKFGWDDAVCVAQTGGYIHLMFPCHVMVMLTKRTKLHKHTVTRSHYFKHLKIPVHFAKYHVGMYIQSEAQGLPHIRPCMTLVVMTS